MDELDADIGVLKKQNLSQSVKSIQDDLLLLRSQLDVSINRASNNRLFETTIHQQLQEMQYELQSVKKRLDNSWPY